MTHSSSTGATGQLHFGIYGGPSPSGPLLGGREWLSRLCGVQLRVSKRRRRPCERHQRGNDGWLGGAGGAAGFRQEEWRPLRSYHFPRPGETYSSLPREIIDTLLGNTAAGIGSLIHVSTSQPGLQRMERPLHHSWNAHTHITFNCDSSLPLWYSGRRGKTHTHFEQRPPRLTNTLSFLVPIHPDQ